MSSLSNVREAVRHVDEVAVSRVAFYHVWAVVGWLAILAVAYFGVDRVMPVLGPYITMLDAIPGFSALPEVLQGEYCLPRVDAARLAFAVFLIFIPLSWLIYLSRIAPRYLRAVRKVADSAVRADPADRKNHIVAVDFGWSRDRYRYPGFLSGAIYLIVALGVPASSLWYPHLVGLGCAGTWRDMAWLIVEVLFGGLLAVMAPHAAVLMGQAVLLRRGHRA